MKKLVVGIIGDHCEDTLLWCLKSVKDADRIFFVWGGESVLTKKKLDGAKGLYPQLEVKESLYDHSFAGQNGRQRNFYLDMCRDWIKKESVKDDVWMLVLDPDEVVDNFSKYRECIESVKKDFVCLKMEHFINNLFMVDATMPAHFAPVRLFKISSDIVYPEVEHPVLSLKEQALTTQDVDSFSDATIWHLGYIYDSIKNLKRYKTNLSFSNIHSKKFLRHWYMQHLLGIYPTKRIHPLMIPKVLREEFMIEDIEDELYFNERMNMPGGAVFEVKEWIQYFGLNEKSKVIDCGCGVGHRVRAFSLFNVPCVGFDKSSYAVQNTPHIKVKEQLWCDDITSIKDTWLGKDEKYDLAIIYDVLEHLKPMDLIKAIEHIKKLSNKFIFSIPFVGENLDVYNDITHKIFETREWWIKQFNDNGIIVKPAPSEWENARQILIGEIQ